MDINNIGSDESDEEPQVYSSKTGIEQHATYEKNRICIIKKQKEQLKEQRRERHEKNKMQKKLKKEKLEKLETEMLPQELESPKGSSNTNERIHDLESKKFPEELMELVKEQKKNVIEERKRKNLGGKNMTKKKKVKSGDNDDALKVFVEVQSLDKEIEKANSVASKAINYRKDALYNNKSIKRIPSHSLRMLQQKQKFCRS